MTMSTLLSNSVPGPVLSLYPVPKPVARFWALLGDHQVTFEHECFLSSATFVGPSHLLALFTPQQLSREGGRTGAIFSEKSDVVPHESGRTLWQSWVRMHVSRCRHPFLSPAHSAMCISTEPLLSIASLWDWAAKHKHDRPQGRKGRQ